MATENKKIKLKLKVGDYVRVMRGNSKIKGKEGKIIFIDTEKQRAIVEGVNLIKKHLKANPNNPQSGGITEKEAPIHISNLMILADGKPSRIGRRTNPETNKLERYAKKTNETLK